MTEETEDAPGARLRTPVGAPVRDPNVDGSHWLVSVRRKRLPGSVVTLVRDNDEAAPPHEERRLARVLTGYFPRGCGLNVVVSVEWIGEERLWAIHAAHVIYNAGAPPHDITTALATSLTQEGIPTGL